MLTLTDADPVANQMFQGAGRAVANAGSGWFAAWVSLGPVVDVHSHFMPLDLPDLGASTADGRWPSLRTDDGGKGRIVRGAETFRVVTSACWDLEVRLRALDDTGVERQVISPVPVSFVYWAEPNLAVAFARAQNERLAETAGASAGRLIAFGGVPLQDVDAAIAELERVVGALDMAGVEIGTSVEGRELDDAALRPFFSAAESLGVPIFVHPCDGARAIRRQGQPYEFGLGMLTDTALAAAALVFGGVLEDCPNLKVGLAHGCGTFAWAYPRIANGSTLLPGSKPPDATEEMVRRMWVDSLVFDPLHLPLLFERFGADHVMLGSDAPFYPSAWGAPQDVVTGAVKAGLCDEATATGILGANALEFLAANTAANDAVRERER
jgi:aminocarboxymuconate-semialdehyde decarboxylase